MIGDQQEHDEQALDREDDRVRQALGHAHRLAARLKREAGPDPAARVRLALTLVASRRPSDGEVRRGVDLMAALASRDGLSPDRALEAFSLVALNLNEFLYVD